MLDVKYVCALLIRRCRNAKDLVQGRRVHARAVENGLSSDRFIANLLVEMYGKCGEVEDAQAVFDEIKDPNLFSWTNLFSAYAINGHLQKARDVFSRMPEKDQVSWNALIQAHTCNGDLSEAKKLFDDMRDRDVISWTTVLTAYAQDGDFAKAKAMFERMPKHDLISRNAMMNSYVQNRDVERASEMFFSISHRDISSWTTILAANAENRHPDRVAEWFQRMPGHNVVAWTILCVSYAQTGDISEAGRLFSAAPEKNLVAWNSMVQACARNGYAEAALAFYSWMELEGVRPNLSTFLSVLNACNHIGLVKIGRKYFLAMVDDHGLKPTHRHLCCMIDILARAGWLDEAEELAGSKMPDDDQAVVWNSLVGACKLHGDTDRGERAGKRVMELHSQHALPYVMLSNIYSQ